MLFRALFLALSLVVGGCAVPVDRAAIKSQIAGKSLSVVVTAGDDIETSWIGTTVFNNERKTLGKPEWNLKATIESFSEQKLKQGELFREVRLEKTDKKNKSDIVTGLKSDSDFLLVLSTSSSGDYVWLTNQPWIGIGVRQRSAFGLPPSAIGHVALAAEIVDRKSGQRVAITSDVRHQFITAPLEQDATLKPASEASLREVLSLLIKISVQDLFSNLGLL